MKEYYPVSQQELDDLVKYAKRSGLYFGLMIGAVAMALLSSAIYLSI